MFKTLSSKLTGKFAAFAAVAALSLSGCKQDGDIVTVNVPNTKQNAKVTYVIQVMEANGVSGASAGIQGATVRFFNGVTQKFEDSKASDADGNIVLANIQPGNFSGMLSAANYGTISFVADLSKGGPDTAYTAISRVHLFPQTASLKGRVYGNYAMNGNVPNPTSATDVQEVDLMLNYTLVQNGNLGYPMGNGPGRLVNVDLNPMSFSIHQGAGTTGFQQDQVYSTESGMVQATLSMVPQRFTAGSGTSLRDSTFTLVGGNPRNSIRVNLYRNAGSDAPTNLGNLLAKPTTQP